MGQRQQRHRDVLIALLNFLNKQVCAPVSEYCDAEAGNLISPRARPIMIGCRSARTQPNPAPGLSDGPRNQPDWLLCRQKRADVVDVCLPPPMPRNGLPFQQNDEQYLTSGDNIDSSPVCCYFMSCNKPTQPTVLNAMFTDYNYNAKAYRFL